MKWKTGNRSCDDHKLEILLSLFVILCFEIRKGVLYLICFSLHIKQHINLIVLSIFYWFHSVWQKLEEENADFFRAYYIRLKLKKQILLFNHLLEHQYHLTKYPVAPKVPLAPIQNGIHPMPGKFSACNRMVVLRAQITGIISMQKKWVFGLLLYVHLLKFLTLTNQLLVDDYLFWASQISSCLR